ncbi:MAG: hypothetical protein HC831_14230 [Chloroflexia bacterium]|nr:hypothetical protein [Chloroflexia bacterium]
MGIIFEIKEGAFDGLTSPFEELTRPIEIAENPFEELTSLFEILESPFEELTRPLCRLE